MMVEARGIIDHVENLVMKHHFRKANMLVDHLENEAVNLTKVTIMKSEFPKYFLQLNLKYVDALVMGDGDGVDKYEPVLVIR